MDNFTTTRKEHERFLRVEAALKKIADQKTLSELSLEGDDCEGDFEGAYDAMIEAARQALNLI